MRVSLRVSLLALSCCGVSRGAETAPPVAPARAESLPPIFVPRPAPKAKAPTIRAKAPTGPAPTRRAISPELAAKLTEVARDATPPANPNRRLAESIVVSSEPASDTVQLEPFIVEEQKYDFKERDLLTKKGKIDLMMKQHPGLNLGPISLGNGDVALAMAEEEFANQRRAEMKDLSGLMSIGNEKPSAEMKKTLNESRAKVEERSKKGLPLDWDRERR